MTRACQCGGIIRQHQLTGEREAWTCNACGRYGAIPRECPELGEMSGDMFAMSEPEPVAGLTE